MQYAKSVKVLFRASLGKSTAVVCQGGMRKNALLLRSFGDLNDVDTSLNFAIRKLSLLLTRGASPISLRAQLNYSLTMISFPKFFQRRLSGSYLYRMSSCIMGGPYLAFYRTKACNSILNLDCSNLLNHQIRTKKKVSQKIDKYEVNSTSISNRHNIITT